VFEEEFYNRDFEGVILKYKENQAYLYQLYEVVKREN
jgi:hypothetical protein